MKDQLITKEQAAWLKLHNARLSFWRMKSARKKNTVVLSYQTPDGIEIVGGVSIEHVIEKARTRIALKEHAKKHGSDSVCVIQ